MPFSTRFSKERLTHSDTAVRLGIDNSIPAALEGNLMALSQFLEYAETRLQAKYGPNAKLSISSGYRGPKLNKAIGGSLKSDHMEGLAADVKCNVLSPLELAKFFKSIMTNYRQIIHEFGSWCHVAVAPASEVGKKQDLTATKRAGKTIYLSGLVPV